MPLSLRLLALAALPIALAVTAMSRATAQNAYPPIYVAPSGDDRWSGKLPAPNATRTDGPFASLGRAQQAAAALVMPENRARREIRVEIRGGFYPLSAPISLSPAASGTPVTPILYTAFKNEKPVFSGGTRITGWKQSAPGYWEVTLPDVAEGKWYFSQLYVNGERRYRPRLPKTGYYTIAGEVASTPKWAGKGFDRFRFTANDIKANWQNRDDVEVLPFHIWTMSRFKIADVDETGRIVTFTGGTRNVASFTKMGRGSRYLVDNVKEALSEPGQWYLDRKTGVLTYLAQPGEDPNKAEIIAPRLNSLLEIKGDPAGKAFVSNLTFRGLTFAHSGWNIGPEGNSYAQAEVNIPGTISVVGGRYINFENCTVRNIGTYALEFGQGTQHCAVTSCELWDLGAGGVKIGETRNQTDDNLLASHNTVQDCLMAEGGRIHPAAVGVWIGHSPYNTITHNEIVDFYYTGISPGWSWGYGPSGAHHNTLTYNHIHKIGQGVLSDMGGIYTLGVSPETLIDHNRIHDIDSFSYGGWGIYYDEGSTGITSSNNVVYNTKSAPFHQHYGTNNVVRNNILAMGREAQLMRTRVENNNRPNEDKSKELSFTITHNIVYWTQGPLLGSNWSGNNFKIDDNLYWNAAGQPVLFGKDTLANWQEKGFDKGSVVADPLFVAPEKGNFALRPGSPATKIGFQPIDISTAGRQSRKPYTRSVPRAFPPPPPPAPPRPLADDFEDYASGETPGDPLSVHVESVPGTSVVVTEETAANGKYSIKVTDAPGQKQRFNPHLYYHPSFSKGTIVGTFALRVEPGAYLYHEWRTGGSPYNAGPALTIDETGALLANGKKLTDLPTGRWIRFEITCVLGSGTYDLTVRWPGRTPPMTYKGLPCRNGTAFNSLNWWGFVSDKDGSGVFYLDDLSLKPLEK